jgi:hypothetical protein
MDDARAERRYKIIVGFWHPSASREVQQRHSARILAGLEHRAVSSREF